MSVQSEPAAVKPAPHLIGALDEKIQQALTQYLINAEEAKKAEKAKLDYNQVFIDAIRRKKMVRVEYLKRSKRNFIPATKLCIPLDFAPKLKAENRSNWYHFWDSDCVKPHPFALKPIVIQRIEITTSEFDPADFVDIDWKINWFVQRDWGVFS